MGKFFKILAGLLLTLVLLVAATAVILLMVIDPNDYKEEIISHVHEHAGRTLRIDGDIKLSVFPWLGLEINGLELSNAKGFGDRPFAIVKHAEVRVKLMPLLVRRLEVDTIGLDGLVLNLANAGDGRTNWDDLLKGEPGEVEVKEESAWAGGLAVFRIGGVDISNARISWDDRVANQHFIIDQFNLNSGAIAPGQPVGLELGMLLTSREPAIKAMIRMQGSVTVNEAAGRLKVSGLTIMLDAEGAALPNGALHAKLETDLSLTLSGQDLSLEGLMLTLGDLRLSGDLKGDALNTQPVFNGTLALAEFNLRDWLSGQGLAVPEMADSAALTRVGASLALSTQGKTTRLDDLKVTLDETQVTGGGSLTGSAITFDLIVDAIDLDRYLLPKREDGLEKPASKGEATTGDDPLLPVEMLRKLDLNGQLKIGRITVSKLRAEEILVTVKALDGRLDVSKQIQRFYQGSYKGQVGLNVKGKTPWLQLEQQLSKVQVGPLLKDLTGQDRLNGRGRFHTKLHARGSSLNAIKRTLGGGLDFRFEDGAVRGFNLAQTLREARAKFRGETLPKTEAPPQTDFSELSGSAVITKGVLSNRDLLAKSPYLRVSGTGQVNLVPETLDYKVKAMIVNTAKGQGGVELNKLKGIPIPVHLTGPYAAPDYSIDWGGVLVGSQKARIEEKKEEIKQKLQDKLRKFLH